MLDTNILVSMIFFQSTQTAAVASALSVFCEIVISDYVLNELRDITNRKFPHKARTMEQFIGGFSFELVGSPSSSDDVPDMRDPNDTPILAAAIDANVDILLTGDKDFLSLDIARPKIMSMREFLRTLSR